jgi:hypothetical protein
MANNIIAQQNAVKNNLVLTFNHSFGDSLIAPPDVSMVVGDSTDPATIYGVAIDMFENNKPLADTSIILKATSSNISVLSDNNIFITQNAGTLIVKIKPYGIGYTTVTLNVIDKNSSKNIDINYAVSQAGFLSTSTTCWHTGNADASAAIALDSNYMIIGDDEMNRLVVHHRHQSGLPVAVFDYSDLLNLSDGEPGNFKEVDVEAAAKSLRSNTIYWLGSMSNNSSYKLKLNRDRIFATKINGTGASTNISFAGYFQGLRNQIIDWGNKYGYKLSASAASGQNAKAIDGFNAEGMVFGPDSNTLYIGMRAPLVPLTDRKNALIVPVQNFENWFNSGKPLSRAAFGTPIELDLGGRGIRDMIRLSNGVYIIVAGSCTDQSSSLGAFFKWTGNANDSAMILNTFDISNLGAEGVMEMDDEKGELITDELQTVTDDGNDVYYGDTIKAKDLPDNKLKKFHSDIPVSSLPVLTFDTRK